MSYRFDNNTSFEEYDEYVLDWARDEEGKAPRVRVQAFATTAREKWGLQWSNKRDVAARFNEEKIKHLPSIEKAAGALRCEEFRVYVID